MNGEQLRAELLPCPFCDGSVSFHQDDEECRDGCHYIECKTCGTFDLSTAADPTNTVEDLGELRARITPLWNRRAALQSQDAERLQAAARDIFVRASEIEVLYGTNKETEGLVMAAMRLAYLVGTTEKAIDHARRVEENK